MNLIDKSRTYIEDSVVIKDNVTIYPDVYLIGNTIIENNVTIYPFTLIKDSTIKEDTVIYSSHIENSIIGTNNKIGPYSNIRENTETSNNCKIGTFVETKNTKVNNNSIIPHLSYLGDTLVGSDVNVGCGVVTANYDGKNKHKCTIDDNAFIGSNVTLISPIYIGKNTKVAAGSTITDDVEDNKLVIARAKQVNKELIN